MIIHISTVLPLPYGVKTKGATVVQWNCFINLNTLKE